MAPKYKETLVNRPCSQHVFMEELRLQVKSSGKAETESSVFFLFFCLSPLRKAESSGMLNQG